MTSASSPQTRGDREAQTPFIPPKHYNRVENVDSAIVEKGRNLFPVLSTVGTFGAALALASFYSERQLSNDPRTLALLAWAYTAYAVATVTTLVWQLALLSNIWVAARRVRLFRSERGILLALGLSILSIAAGTVIVSLALLQPPDTSQGVVIGAYTATGAIASIVLFTILRFVFVWTRRTTERGYEIFPFSLNSCLKPTHKSAAVDPRSTEIGEFLEMYAQHGERLARLYESHSMHTVDNQEAAEMLYRAQVALEYEHRHEPKIDAKKKNDEVGKIMDFITRARSWHKTLDMLNTFDRGHFYKRPHKEQVWRFKILLGDAADEIRMSEATSRGTTPMK